MKLLFLAAGWICVVLGVAGAFLPLLPTTPFLLAALFFFARSSPRLQRRLLRWTYLRQFYENYRSGCGIPVRTRNASLFFLWTTLGLSACMKSAWWYWAILGTVGIAVSCHLLLLKTYKVSPHDCHQ